MRKKYYENKISEIIKSQIFIDKLTFLNEHYSNLKQELLIRNIILEELNKYFNSERLFHLKAFAEHPRIDKARVDLSIVNEQDLEHPILIEFKYQFTNDFKQLSNYKGVIYNDFENRKSDMFILIISNWIKTDKEEFDKHWGITSNLSRYITKNIEWKLNIENILSSFEKTDLEIFNKITINKPYPSEYFIYNLKRK